MTTNTDRSFARSADDAVRHAAGWGETFAEHHAQALFGVTPVEKWAAALEVHPRDAALFGDCAEGSAAAAAFVGAAQARWVAVRAEHISLMERAAYNARAMGR